MNCCRAFSCAFTPVWAIGVCCLSSLVAGATTANDTPLMPQASGLFERAEPNLADGLRALRDGRTDDAITSFRRAKSETKEERAVVEYDIGHALLAQGLSEAETGAGEDNQNDTQQVFEEAAEAFERAYGLTENQRFRSAAAQAAGNAKAQKGDLKGAVEAFRRSMIADPKNEGARKNLASVLRAIQAQPPSPPSEPDENSDDNKNSDDDENSDEDKNQSENQKADGDDPSTDRERDRKGQNQQSDDEKQDGTQDARDKQDPSQEKSGDSSAQKETQSSATEDAEQKRTPKDGAAPGDTQKPTTEDQTKAQAHRLLDQMRNREKPLVPLWMRGNASKRPPPEKDW